MVCTMRAVTRDLLQTVRLRLAARARVCSCNELNSKRLYRFSYTTWNKMIIHRCYTPALYNNNNNSDNGNNSYNEY